MKSAACLLALVTSTFLASCQVTPSLTQLVGSGDGEYVRRQCPAGQYVKSITAVSKAPAAGEVSPDFRLSRVSFSCSALNANGSPTYHELFNFNDPGTVSTGACSTPLAALGSAIVRMTYDGTSAGKQFVGNLYATCFRPDLGMAIDTSFTVGIGGSAPQSVSCTPPKLAVGLQARINHVHKAAVGFGLLCG